MKKRELKIALSCEVDKLCSFLFDELIGCTYPKTEKRDAGYQVEIQILEKTDEYVHFSVSVDDGKLLRSIFPLSTSIIIHKDGKIER